MSAEIVSLAAKRSSATRPPVMVVIYPQHPHIVQMKLYTMADFLGLVQSGQPLVDQHHQPWHPPYSFQAYCRDGAMAVYWLRNRYEAGKIQGKVEPSCPPGL